MSRVLKVSQSNYRLVTQAGGNIILDPGSTGTVTVTGNLDVKGTTTTIESTNSTIADNIIQLNYGQTGTGISSALGYNSGIEISRGSYSPAQFLFNEQITHWNPVSNSNASGGFIMRTADGTAGSLQVGTIGNNGASDFVIDMQNGTNAILIANSANYAGRVSNINHVINLGYLTSYVSATNGQAVVDKIYYSTGGYTSVNSPAEVQTLSTSISFLISQAQKASISSAGLTVNNININSDTISNTGSNNLTLSATNNNIEVTGVLNLDNFNGSPTAGSNTVKLYSTSTVGPGKTGLYTTNLINNGLTTVSTTDELISKNRAVLLSILL
jgi:hypothetical protein